MKGGSKLAGGGRAPPIYRAAEPHLAEGGSKDRQRPEAIATAGQAEGAPRLKEVRGVTVAQEWAQRGGDFEELATKWNPPDLSERSPEPPLSEQRSKEL